MKRVLAGVVCALAMSACVAHPVGPARTYGKYESKARTSAKSVASSLQTALLAVRAAGRDRMFGPYLSELLSDCEDDASKVQNTFDSIQPPNPSGDRLRNELDDLLTDALDQLGEVRIMARRGRLADLGDKAGDLEQAAQRLDDFDKAHGG
jgi:hypothetical protein